MPTVEKLLKLSTSDKIMITISKISELCNEMKKQLQFLCIIFNSQYVNPVNNLKIVAILIESASDIFDHVANENTTLC